MTTAARERATQLTGIAPQFLVDDLDRAIAYYRDQLGFELDFKYQSFYAAVTRDGLANPSQVCTQVCRGQGSPQTE